MERKTFSVIALCVALLSIGFVSCDSDSEPYEETTVETEVVDSIVGIGLSESQVELDDYYNYGEVEMLSTDWILSNIVFEETTSFQSKYITNLSGANDFKKSYGWLDIQYSNGVMSLSANDYYVPERVTDRRCAKLIFTYGSDNALADTLTCVQLPSFMCVDGNVKVQPASAYFPKEGGTCIFTMVFDTFCLDEIVFGDNPNTGKKYDLQDTNDVYPVWYKPLEPYQATVEWVTLSRTEAYEFTVSVDPNETGEERMFWLLVNILIDQQWVRCYQSAE